MKLQLFEDVFAKVPLVQNNWLGCGIQFSSTMLKVHYTVKSAIVYVIIPSIVAVEIETVKGR